MLSSPWLELCCYKTEKSLSSIQLHFSYKLSPVEQNYGIGNWKLLAFKLDLEEWWHWLEGAAHLFTYSWITKTWNTLSLPDAWTDIKPTWKTWPSLSVRRPGLALHLRDIHQLHTCKKLGPEYIVPFKFLKQINEITYKLDLPHPCGITPSWTPILGEHACSQSHTNSHWLFKGVFHSSPSCKVYVQFVLCSWCYQAWLSMFLLIWFDLLPSSSLFNYIGGIKKLGSGAHGLLEWRVKKIKNGAGVIDQCESVYCVATYTVFWIYCAALVFILHMLLYL